VIDFRYHLVSLISVFLALAVGIALGAGPLKEAIGDTLTGQVDQLRAEKDALRAELDVTALDLQHAQASLASVAPALLEGVLAERRVAIVLVDEVPAEVLEQVVARLAEAGASVTATVTVTEAWTDPERLSFRQSLAGTLVTYLDPAPAQDAGTGTELAEALAQGLTTAVPENPDALSENAAIVLDLLGGDAGLITLAGDVTVPADAVVVLSGPAGSLEATTAAQDVAAEDLAEPTDEEAALLQARIDAGVQIATAVQARSTGAVVAGGALTDPSVVLALRQDESASIQVTTVEDLGTLAGQVAVPLALAARISGTVGHYGASPEATSAMPPRVVLPPVERVAVVVDPATVTTDAPTAQPEG